MSKLKFRFDKDLFYVTPSIEIMFNKYNKALFIGFLFFSFRYTYK